MIRINILAGDRRPHITQRFTLDGRDYQLTLTWNQRQEKWYLSVADSDGTRLQGQVLVVADFPLLRLLNADARPLGVLMALDTSGQGLDPHLRDFENGRVQMWYMQDSEL
jgi:hypothetical protein